MKIIGHLMLILGLCMLSCKSENQERKKLIENAPLISQKYIDDTGKEIVLPGKPKKVLSLAPNITEIIFAIGAEDKLIGRSQACDYPEAALYVQEFQTYPSLDLEQIKASDADLLLVTDEIFTEENVLQLERLGMNVYRQSYKKLEDVYRGIKKLGVILDVEAQAEHLADSLADLEKRIIARTEGLAKYRTIMLIKNDAPLMVAGGGGYLNTLIEKAGAKNVFASLPKAYQDISPEDFVASKPEYLILPSSSDQAYAELVANFPALYFTKAQETGQIHIVDPDILYRPGPRLLDGLLMLSQIFHSQLTKDQFVPAP
ncbi:MAG: helical backbone metal receptor [Bacteroidia bacterium]|nr:helical backbone metal receptor [Bacteroidia bacterium]